MNQSTNDAVEFLLTRMKGGDRITFQEVLAHIHKYHHYIPTRFKNGLNENTLVNEPGQNEGSCVIFSFALYSGLSKEDTLSLFCEHYQEVLTYPEGRQHQNIRHFMESGWEGILFEGNALIPRTLSD